MIHEHRNYAEPNERQYDVLAALLNDEERPQTAGEIAESIHRLGGYDANARSVNAVMSGNSQFVGRGLVTKIGVGTGCRYVITDGGVEMLASR